jgi:hypothetical protein
MATPRIVGGCWYIDVDTLSTLPRLTLLLLSSHAFHDGDQSPTILVKNYNSNTSQPPSQAHCPPLQRHPKSPIILAVVALPTTNRPPPPLWMQPWDNNNRGEHVGSTPGNRGR